jgi:maltokinase
LRAALPQWLATQRWYGGHEPPVEVDLLHVDPLTDGWPLLVWCPTRTVDRDGVEATYQLLLGLDVDPPAEVEAHALAEVTGDGDQITVYPALVDERLRLVLARQTAPSTGVRSSALLSGDFSNTSVVFDGRWLLKVFRRLDLGPNPDAEVPVGLGRVGCDDVTPVPVGVWTRDGWDLAIMRRFVADATDGQAVMAASLEACLHAGRPPHQCEPDVEPLARSLGETIARLHLGLADAFGTEPMTGEELSSLLLSRLEAVTDEGVDVDGIAETFRQLRTAGDLGVAMRIHGDLHLAQCLHPRRGDWLVMDFEGEPLRPMIERRLPSSPLRDVAGVIRSLGYVAELGLVEAEVDRDSLDGRDQVVLAEAWEQRAVDGFVAGYSSVGGIDALMPVSPTSRDAVLSVFELDKALYEIIYERAHRPSLVGIPRRAVARLTAADHHRRW